MYLSEENISTRTQEVVVLLERRVVEVGPAGKGCLARGPLTEKSRQPRRAYAAEFAAWCGTIVVRRGLARGGEGPGPWCVVPQWFSAEESPLPCAVLGEHRAAKTDPRGVEEERLPVALLCLGVLGVT